MKKTIAVIGAAGRMGSGIVRLLSESGYNLLLAGRDRQKLDALTADIKKSNPSASIEVLDCSKEASWEADIIIPAVPYSSQPEVAMKISDVVTGKIVISITNPLNENYDSLLTQYSTSSAEELAALLPYSKIIKAFNTISSFNLSLPAAQREKVDIYLAGDDEKAVESIAEIVNDSGFYPVKAGKLSESRILENMALLLIKMKEKNNLDWSSGWKIFNYGKQ